MNIIRYNIIGVFFSFVFAGEASGVSEALFTAIIRMLVSTFLVFIMHLGCSLETGLTQSKNTVNILFKCKHNAIGILTYALCGFNLMYPGDLWLLWFCWIWN